MIDKDRFDERGYIVVKEFYDSSQTFDCRVELERALEDSLNEHPGVFDAGMVHNCFLYGESMLRLLADLRLREVTDFLLCPNAIVYAYQSSSLPPGSENYGSRIHCDCPRFFYPHRTNLGFILALNDFTFENGATEVLPGSHRSSSIPTSEDFNESKITLTCAAGDAIFFDARLFHRAGSNSTNGWRHALTINFCRPFMRSRFDFPRLIDNCGLKLPKDGSLRKYLGYDVRVPTSLSEFYRPEGERLYKSGQE